MIVLARPLLAQPAPAHDACRERLAATCQRWRHAAEAAAGSPSREGAERPLGRSSSASALTSEGCQLAARSDVAARSQRGCQSITAPVGPLLLRLRRAHGPPPAPCVRASADDDRPGAATSGATRAGARRVSRRPPSAVPRGKARSGRWADHHPLPRSLRSAVRGRRRQSLARKRGAGRACALRMA
jgi:hypothetical protein